MKKETIIKRLAIAKYLYKVGMDQSYSPESIAFTSILSFHDSVEIFLKVVAEYKNVNSHKFSFMDYWDKISDLTFREQMRNLNSIRVNLKHKGILPSKQDIEINRIYVNDFLTEITKNIFNLNFAEITLIELINYKSTRDLVKLSQDALINSDFEKSIEHIACAFFDLLSQYKETKDLIFRDSHFK